MADEAQNIEQTLFRSLTDEITEEEFTKIKGALRLKKFGGFGAGEIQREVKTVDKLLEKLTRKGIIKLGDYRRLRELFTEIQSLTLNDHIQKAENALLAIQWPVQQYPETAPGTAQATGWPLANYTQPHLGRGYVTPGALPHLPGHGAPYYQQPSGFGYHPGYMHGEQPFQNPVQAYAGIDNRMGPPQASALRQQIPQPQPESQADTLPRASSFERAEVFPQNQLFEHRIFYEPGRGYVLFVNNFFSGKPEYRRGADVDEDHVRELFQLMPGYYLEYKRDVTKAEFQSYLSALRETLSTGNYRTFILILGTHGEPRTSKDGGPTKDAVLMADNEWLLVDHITSSFHGDQIPAMKDKPKIFIIQSCRGKERLRAVSLSDSPATVSSPDVFSSLEQSCSLTRPVNSDVLIAYATTEGTKAWRNVDEGSWFVKDLYDVIKEFYDKEHILDILVRVNSRMVWRESTEGRAKQMPCFVCTFTKRFMFKLPASHH